MRLRTPVCGHRARRGNCFIISFLHSRYASRGGSLMGWGQLYISLETSVLCEDWIYRGNIIIPAEKTNTPFSIYLRSKADTPLAHYPYFRCHPIFLVPTVMRRENRARAFIAPPLGGWEGLNQHGGLTVVWSKREMEGPPGTGMPSERKATGSWPWPHPP